jgi:hypothetical protein
MYELGAQFDWDSGFPITMREDTSTNSLARFEHHEVDAALVKAASGGKPGSAGAYDNDLSVAHGAGGRVGR